MPLADKCAESKLIDNEWIRDAEEHAAGMPYTCRDSIMAFIRHSRPLTSNQETEIESIEELRQKILRSIPKEALSDILFGRSVLIAGAGFSLPDDTVDDGVARSLTGAQINQDLVQRLSPSAASSASDLPTASGLYEKEHGQAALHDHITSLCRDYLPVSPRSHHKNVALLSTMRFIITTNWDRLFETAFRSVGTSYRSVLSDQDLSRIDFGGRNLFKLNGDFTLEHQSDGTLNIDSAGWASNPRITKAELEAFGTECPALSEFLKSLSLSHRLIVVGLHPSDDMLQDLLKHIRPRNDVRQPIIVDPSSDVTADLSPDDSIHVQMPANDFFRTVREFVRFDGGRVGRAFANPRRYDPLPKLWASTKSTYAQQLITMFPALRCVEVVDATARSGYSHPVEIRGADVLGSIMADKDKHRLSVSCGSTIRGVIESIPSTDRRFEGVSVWGTTVPMADSSAITSPFALVSLMASQLSSLGVAGHGYQLPETFAYLAASRKVQKHFQQANYERFGVASSTPETGPSHTRTLIQDYLDTACGAHAFLLGVGASGQGATALDVFAEACLRQAILNSRKEARDRLVGGESISEQTARYFREIAKRHQLIGDIMYRFFAQDDHGRVHFVGEEEFIDCINAAEDRVESRIFREFCARLHTHAMSFNPEVLQSVSTDSNREVVLVGAGHIKARAFAALLEKRIGTVLVVDEPLARGIIDRVDR